jgi:hypothetical protein
MPTLEAAWGDRARTLARDNGDMIRPTLGPGGGVL